MNASQTPMPDRVLELLADRALEGLDAAQQAELSRLLREHGLAEDATFEMAAASLLQAGGAEAEEPVPESLKRRLEESGRRWCAEALRREKGAAPIRIERSRRVNVLPWLAAAAGIALAVVAWWPRIQMGAGSPSGRRARLLTTAPDAVRAPWGDWDNPEIKGVTGDVVWSDAEQKGYIRLAGLPANDRSKQQYQLWIIDATRGMEQRISGGVFDGGAGEVVVPIEAAIPVKKAAAFAVTIEQPGGTWVSDMKRRVVIAKTAG